VAVRKTATDDGGRRGGRRDGLRRDGLRGVGLRDVGSAGTVFMVTSGRSS
jgi:hypothetical protein